MRRRLMHDALVLLAAGLTLGAATTTAASNDPDGAPPSAEARPTATDRAIERELHALAEAWAEGGGTYGYPFWEKAQERWRAGGLSASQFREYATGYRDNLRLGCDLLGAVETEQELGKDVRSRLVQACEARVDALRAQRRQLDGVIDRAAAPSGSLDEEELAEQAEEIAAHQATVVEKLQESYRIAREAMDLAQSELDGRGLDRLPEDAFV